MDYYNLPEVSNSDLSWLKEQTSAKDAMGNKEQAYFFGNLTDAVLTEPEKIDFFKNTIEGKEYSKEEMIKVKKMRNSFIKDKFCMQVLQQGSFQKVFRREVELEYNGIKFTLPMRCKYDLWMDIMGYGGDIKSTVATSQEQFDNAIKMFDYDRQRAVYMTLAECDYDVLIGISKINYKVFKTFIKRGDKLFEEGMAEFRMLAYKYYNLFY